jgi:hypothetical protein
MKASVSTSFGATWRSSKKKRYEAHANGEKPLSEDELLELTIEKLMLEER